MGRPRKYPLPPKQPVESPRLENYRTMLSTLKDEYVELETMLQTLESRKTVLEQSIDSMNSLIDNEENA